MSNSSQVQFRFLKEVEWGVTPASAMTNLNITSESLDVNTDTANSEFIRSDTNLAGVVRTSVTSGGDVGIELQYGAYDDFLEGALRGAFATDAGVTASTTIAAVASGNEYTSTAEFGNILVGQFIEVRGFTDPANNGYFKVITVGSTSSINVFSGATLVNEGVGPSVTIKGAFLKNAATDQSWTLEKEFSDITQFMSFTGMRVGVLALTITPGSIITGTITFQGKDGTRGTSTVGTGGPTAAATTESMNAVDNVLDVRIDNVLSVNEFVEISLNMDTKPRSQQAIGNLNNIGVGTGTFEVTGTMSVYLEDGTLLDKYLNFDNVELSFVTEDALGNAYVFNIPKVNFTAATTDAGGIDQDVLVPLTFTASYDLTFDGTMGITRVTA